MTAQSNAEAPEPTATPLDPAEVGQFWIDMNAAMLENERQAEAIADEMDDVRRRAVVIEAEGTRLRDAARDFTRHPSRTILFNRNVL